MSAVLMFLFDHPAAFWGVFLALVCLSVYGFLLLIETAEANDSARHSAPAPRATSQILEFRREGATSATPTRDRQKESA